MSEGYLFTNTFTQETVTFSSSAIKEFIYGINFNNEAIKCSAINNTVKLTDAAVTFRFPYINTFAQHLLLDTTEDEYEVKIYRNSGLRWSGFVYEISQQDKEIVVVARTLMKRFKITGVTDRVSVSCSYNVYDKNTCRLDPATVGETFNVTNLNGTQLTLNTLKPSNYYLNGRVSYKHWHRHILQQLGSTFYLDKPFPETINGSIQALPTCNFTYANCQALGNQINYGGAANLPYEKNPFGSSGAI